MASFLLTLRPRRVVEETEQFIALEWSDGFCSSHFEAPQRVVSEDRPHRVALERQSVALHDRRGTRQRSALLLKTVTLLSKGSAEFHGVSETGRTNNLYAPNYYCKKES